MKTTLGTHRFQRAVMDGRPIKGPRRAMGRMRGIASDKHSTLARRLRGVWFRSMRLSPLLHA